MSEALTGRRTPRRTTLVQALAPVLLLLLVPALGACGGDGGDGGDGGISAPTRTPSADRTLEEPTERPTQRPTDRPTSDRTDRPDPDETGEPTPEEPDADRPTPTRDRPEEPEEPEETEETEGDGVPAAPAPDPTVATTSPAPVEAEEDDAEESVPAWVWWLLAAVLLGTAVALPLIVRSRRRAAWRGELAEAEGELAWFARELLPELRHATSREEASGGWTVGQPRVVAAEDRLTVLASSARDRAGQDRCGELLAASRRARTGMQALTGPGPHDTWALDLDAVMDSLEHALSGPDSASSAGPPPPAQAPPRS